MSEATPLIASVETFTACILEPAPETFPKTRLIIINSVVIKKKNENVLNANFPNLLLFLIVTIDKTTIGNISGTITI